MNRIIHYQRVAPEGGLRVHVSFVEDAVTRVAYVWNTVLGGYDINLRCGGVIEMVDAILAQLQQLAPGGQPATIRSLDTAGHGYPGGWCIGLDGGDDQQPPGSPEFARWSRLADLRPRWANRNDGVTMRMCETAQGDIGRQFLAKLAKQLGAKIRGWTGCYEILPTGYEYTGTPGGCVFRSGNTGRHLQLLYYNQEKSHLRRWLTYPVEGLQWTGRMMNLW